VLERKPLVGENMPKTRKSEFECLLSMRDLGKYVGKWIAVVDKNIVVSGDHGKEVFEKAQKECPGREPLIMKVPVSMVMLL